MTVGWYTWRKEAQAGIETSTRQAWREEREAITAIFELGSEGRGILIYFRVLFDFETREDQASVNEQKKNMWVGSNVVTSILGCPALLFYKEAS